MKSIGLVVHPGKEEAAAAAQLLEKLAGERGYRVVEAAGSPAPDVIVALGGDGTMLKAALIAHPVETPLVGVNLGRLGFLSTVASQNIAALLDALGDGSYRIDERMVLEARVEQNGEAAVETIALNEVVLERGTLARIVTINVSVDSERVTSYSADGFIVSTPTGSTAYSLSAGGPVLEPSMDAIVLTSVSAHSPLWRSIVVRADRTITLAIPEDPIAVSADGRTVAALDSGARVTVKASPNRLKLITLSESGFYEKLRSRFQVEPNR